MKTAQNIFDVPDTAVLSIAQSNGSFIYYEENDELPITNNTSIQTKFITTGEFRSSFTDNELKAMLSSDDIDVKLLVLKVTTAHKEGIDLMSATVINGLAYLVTVGILTSNRPAEITA
jgi:hypothetical protein